jgi:hypothetical protein
MQPKKILLILGSVLLSAVVINFLSEFHSIYVTKKMEMNEYRRQYEMCKESHDILDAFQRPCKEATIQMNKYPLFDSFVDAVFKTFVFEFSIGFLSFGTKGLTYLLDGLSIVSILIITIIAILYFQLAFSRKGGNVIHELVWKQPKTREQKDDW